jgi:hypothetical protein
MVRANGAKTRNHFARMRDHARRGALAIAALTAGLATASALPAAAKRPARAPNAHAYPPPSGRSFHGASGTRGRYREFQQFRHRVGAHPAVLEDFFPWNTALTAGALQLWHRTSTRGMLSLSTRAGDGSEILRPGQIANGLGDHYIIRLNRSIAAAGQVVYIRLFPEMNGFWNPYCGFNADGTPRRPGHSAKSFRRAWRRFAIIVRGGSVGAINRRLVSMGMPRLLRAGANDAGVYRADGVGNRLARPKVAMVWNPQTIGDPDIAANRPDRYWPGRRYVDWVGADIYSKYATPGIRAALDRFYLAHRGIPFEIGEYSPWDGDPNGAFVRWLFRWARERPRVRMLVYYRSTYANSVYDVNHYPAARRALRKILDEPRWVSYPAGTRLGSHGSG